MFRKKKVSEPFSQAVAKFDVFTPQKAYIKKIIFFWGGVFIFFFWAKKNSRILFFGTGRYFEILV